MESRRVNIEDPQPIDLDLGLEKSCEVGIMAADAALAAMKKAHDDRYSQGLQSFLQSEITPEQQELIGVAAAALALEERRKTLVSIALRSSAYSAVSIAVALLVGFSPLQSSLCFPVSITIAICTGRKR